MINEYKMKVKIPIEHSYYFWYRWKHDYFFIWLLNFYINFIFEFKNVFLKRQITSLRIFTHEKK